MMKNILSAAIISLALSAPAFAQDAKPATTAPAATAPVVPKVMTPAATATTPAVKPAMAPAATTAPAAAVKPTTVAAPTAAPVPKKMAVKLINLNTATPKELDDLPKIGAARTKSIIAGRPYKTVQDLLDKKIVPKDAFDAIKDKVSVN